MTHGTIKVHKILNVKVFNEASGKRSCLMHYATRRKVTDSVPDGVIGFFN
jgi:hypothetical protein